MSRPPDEDVEMQIEPDRAKLYYHLPNGQTLLTESPSNHPSSSIYDILRHHCPQLPSDLPTIDPGTGVSTQPSTTATSDKLSGWLDQEEATDRFIRFKADKNMLKDMTDRLGDVLAVDAHVPTDIHQIVLVHYLSQHYTAASNATHQRPRLETPQTASFLSGTCHLANTLLQTAEIYRTEGDGAHGAGCFYEEGRRTGRSTADFCLYRRRTVEEEEEEDREGAGGGWMLGLPDVSGERKRKAVHSADDMRLILVEAERARGYTIKVQDGKLQCSVRAMTRNCMSINSQVRLGQNPLVPVLVSKV